MLATQSRSTLLWPSLDFSCQAESGFRSVDFRFLPFFPTTFRASCACVRVRLSCALLHRISTTRLGLVGVAATRNTRTPIVVQQRDTTRLRRCSTAQHKAFAPTQKPKHQSNCVPGQARWHPPPPARCDCRAYVQQRENQPSTIGPRYVVKGGTL